MKDLIILILIIVLVLSWCPWLSTDEAMQLVDAKVMEMKNNNPDLCAMFVHRETLIRVPFGYSEKVSYDCTATDSVYGIEQSFNVAYITFYKSIIGIPVKVVERAP